VQPLAGNGGFAFDQLGELADTLADLLT
jgi:hypothetical protein